MAIDWESHKKHRAQVAADDGVWLGLLDENAEPLMDLPPVIELEAPRTKNAPVSMRALLLVKSPTGVLHPACDELFASGMSQGSADWISSDEEGRVIIPKLGKTRFVMCQWADGERRTYRVSHGVAPVGPELPAKVEVHGTDMLNLLSGVVCFTAPLTVTGHWSTFTRDWAGPEDQELTFSKPRDLQDMKMVTVADGATVDGSAEAVIRRVIKESLEAQWRAIGQHVVDSPPIVVDPQETGLVSPYILLRPQDGYLLDEVLQTAIDNGVSITAEMWLPGDAPVEGIDMSAPTVVVRVRQVVGVA